MEHPYVQYGNIHFIPVVRRRLSFAVLVQRAVDSFKEPPLGRRDLVAAALPQSVAGSVTTAIAKLPAISLVVASVPGVPQREAFAVTPCDGMVEAIRIALEHGIPWRCIEPEIAPGFLGDRPCVDANWPDDTLAVERGAERYLDLVQGLLAGPLDRCDPADAGRELYIAEQLRSLRPRYNRILCVCDVA